MRDPPKCTVYVECCQDVYFWNLQCPICPSQVWSEQSGRRNHVAYWNSSLECLQVQSKFKEIVTLEGSSHVWNHMLIGLPTGQLSFILRVGAVFPLPWISVVGITGWVTVALFVNLPVLLQLISWMVVLKHWTKAVTHGDMTLFLLALLPRSSVNLMSQQRYLVIFQEGKPVNLQ